MNTLDEICDKLKQQDEISLLEILDISSEDIIDRFVDLVENKLEYFRKDLEDEISDDS